MFRYINISTVRFTASAKSLVIVFAPADGSGRYGKLKDIKDSFGYAYAKYEALGKAGKLSVGESKMFQDYGKEVDGVRPGTGKVFVFVFVHRSFNAPGKAEWLKSGLEAVAKAWNDGCYKTLEVEGVLNVAIVPDSLANASFANLSWKVAGPVIAQSEIARLSVDNSKLHVSVGIKPTDPKHPNLVPLAKAEATSNVVEAEPAEAPAAGEKEEVTPATQQATFPASADGDRANSATDAVAEGKGAEEVKAHVAKHTAAHLKGEPATVEGDIDALVDNAVKELVNPFPVPASK